MSTVTSGAGGVGLVGLPAGIGASLRSSVGGAFETASVGGGGTLGGILNAGGGGWNFGGNAFASAIGGGGALGAGGGIGFAFGISVLEAAVLDAAAVRTSSREPRACVTARFIVIRSRNSPGYSKSESGLTNCSPVPTAKTLLIYSLGM